MVDARLIKKIYKVDVSKIEEEKKPTEPQPPAPYAPPGTTHGVVSRGGSKGLKGKPETVIYGPEEWEKETGKMKQEVSQDRQYMEDSLYRARTRVPVAQRIDRLKAVVRDKTQTRQEKIREINKVVRGTNTRYINPKWGESGQLRIVRGDELKGVYSDEIKEYKRAEFQLEVINQQAKQGIREWHPDTKIRYSEKSGKINIDFPYEGAQSYTSYKKSLETGGLYGQLAGTATQLATGGTVKSKDVARFTSLFATSFTGPDPLGIPSAYYTATGQEQKAIDVKIKGVVSGKKPFHEFYLSMPTTHIGLATAAGIGIGAAGGVIGGYAGATLSKSTILAGKVAMIGAGAVVISPSVMDIKTKLDMGLTGEAIGSASVLGLSIAGGYAGYKTGSMSRIGIGKYKGLTYRELGSYKGQMKMIDKGVASGEISPEMGNVLRTATQEKFWFQKQFGQWKNINQTGTKWETIQTMKDKPSLQRLASRFSLRKKVQTFGGSASDKPIDQRGISTHDWDVMMRSARNSVQLKYDMARLGFRYGDVADIKYQFRTGSVTDLYGGVMEKPVSTSTGWQMPYRSQFARLSSSSLNLAHEGRVKDIPETLRMIEMMYAKKYGYMPPEAQMHFESYSKAMNYLYENPRIMSVQQSSYLFGKDYGTKFFKIKEKLAYRLIPKRSFEAGFKKVYDPTGELMLKKANIQVMPLDEGIEAMTFKYTSKNVWGYKHSYPIYAEKPDIFLSENTMFAGTKAEGFQALKHEMLHQLHPRAPEWMIQGSERFLIDYAPRVYNILPTKISRIIPGAENVPNPWLDKIVASRLPPTPSGSLLYQPSSISPTFSSSSITKVGNLIIPSTAYNQPKSKTIYKYNKPPISPFMPNKISLTKTIYPIKTNISKSGFTSKAYTTLFKPSISKTSKSRNLISTNISSPISSPSSSISSSTYIIPPVQPVNYSSPSLYGRGKRGYSLGGIGYRHSMRIRKIKPLIKFKKIKVKI